MCLSHHLTLVSRFGMKIQKWMLRWTSLNKSWDKCTLINAVQHRNVQNWLLALAYIHLARYVTAWREYVDMTPVKFLFKYM